MKYEEYVLEDFLTDDDFIKWVNHPNVGSNMFWESWITQHPEKKPFIEEARLIISSIQFEDASIKEKEILEIWQNLQPGRAVHKGKQRFIRPLISASWQRKAAVFAGLVFFASIYFLMMDYGFDGIKKYSTGYGETRSIILPDGSEVILNANSELNYTLAETSAGSREVWLKGEAFFTVKHTETDQKFIVHSGKINVEVLGTKFNVNHRRGKTKVVLNTGKVKVNRNQDTMEDVVMKPGELVEVVDNPGGGYTKKIVNTELYISWKDNKLVFDGTALTDIAHILEDNYGFTVEIEDHDLAIKKFKGTVEVDEIESLLGQIAKVFNADIDKDGKHITMKPKSKVIEK